jgi:hypothetical protein
LLVLIPTCLHSAVLILAHLHLVPLISNYIYPHSILRLLGWSHLIGVDCSSSCALVHTCLCSFSVIHAQMWLLVVARTHWCSLAFQASDSS